MNIIDLSPESIERIAQRVVELMRAPAPTPQVLTRAEAKVLVRRTSDAAFYQWCKRWKVKPATRNRYSLPTLTLALEREIGIVNVPATLRKFQDELRKSRR